MPDILEIALDDEIRTDRFFNGKRAAHPTERVPLCAVKTKINHRSTRSGYTPSLALGPLNYHGYFYRT